MATSHDPDHEHAWLLDRLRDAERQVQAPAGVHAWVHAQTAAARPRRARPARLRPALAGGMAGLVAVAAAAILLVTAGSAAPTVAQAAALAARGADRSAPAPDPNDPADRLQQAVGDIYFPNWGATLGWRATGQRTDALGGHTATTVYYRSAGETIAYTIVSSPALRQPPAPVTAAGGLRLRMLTPRGRVLVTWRSAGKTCILSGSGTSASRLRRLATWTERPSA